MLNAVTLSRSDQFFLIFSEYGLTYPELKYRMGKQNSNVTGIIMSRDMATFLWTFNWYKMLVYFVWQL